MNTNTVLNVKDLCKTYIVNKRQNNVLKNVNFTVSEGEMVAIIGKSGAGKSTLLHILAAIDSYDKGSYLVDGVSVGDLKEKERARFRNQKMGIVMQDYALIDEYTIEENVQIPLIFGKVKGNDVRREKIMTALENVGLAELAKKPVRQLSGGQKQRVAIARALVNNPTFLLADEPTGALDSKTSGEIMDVFEKLNQGGKTVIIVTHDMEVAARCGRVIEISDGEIV